MSSFESVRWYACVHRLDFGLCSHPKEVGFFFLFVFCFFLNGVRTHVNSKKKIPSTEGSEQVRTRDAASHWTASPTHYRLSYSGPRSRVQGRPNMQTFMHISTRMPPHRLVGLMVKVSASRAVDPGSNAGFFRGRVIPVTEKLALQWLPYQAPGVIGSELGVVGPVSVYCDWVK